MDANGARVSLDWKRRLIFGSSLRRTLLRALVIAGVSLLLFKFVLMPVRVTGGSMLPTYADGSVNFINRLAYIRHGPRRGDVVGVAMAGPSVLLMKRVVGLPGESIGFHRGQVTVDGVRLSEPYLVLPSDWELDPVRVGPEEYFVVGDNRSMSPSDHVMGRARSSRILGCLLW